VALPESTTHFGFQEVAEGDKKQMVGEVFHKVAEKYDLMNDLMSGTLHRLWKDEFVGMLGPVASHGESASCVSRFFANEHHWCHLI
jgi:hypothetical protein